jgi:predicted SAM-dependent methyltransferase
MKIIIGAGGKTQEGWISTEQGQIDIVKGFEGEYDAMLIEDVFEHIPKDEILIALRNCYKHINPDGYIRVSTPDGYNPDPEYIEYVSPPHMGHRVIYNYHVLSDLFAQAGFTVSLLEWFDENGKFNARAWNEIDGNIERCLASDPRNQDGKPHYTSLIMDAKKIIEPRPGLEKAFEFIQNNDLRGLSVYNRRKATAFYELALMSPQRGVIIELGSYHGFGTVPIWYGSQDGKKNKVIAIDSYTVRYGWIGEPYVPEDESIWCENMVKAHVSPMLCKGECRELASTWKEPVALLIHDLGNKGSLVEDLMAWEKHFVFGGIIAIRDLDDYSMGTEEAVAKLISTGRWGKRIDWPAFITSVERIA